ncbi:MAG: FISUMP domain-containing protein [Bacilli bacterium]|jgi:uncharacterized protein (TIGR02145 family)/prepilin-type N-terminal cleavage/methylation domain-containing protein
MKFLFKKKKQGFTLIELLAVIVILAIVLAIALPSITGLIGNTTKKAFLMDAKMVIKAIDYQLLEGYDLESSPITKRNFDEVLNLSAKNYESVSVALDEKDEPYVKLVGQNKWEGLTTCGTYKDMLIGKTNEIKCEVSFVCGKKFFDLRYYSDGIKNTYKTVQIGDQCWFAENLRYTGEGTENFCLVDSIDDWKDESSYGACMKNTDDSCDYEENYCEWDFDEEVLYQWGAVMNDKLESQNEEVIQGLCPDGWHLPTVAEWDTLVEKLGNESSVGAKLKSFSEWNGDKVENSGFNARPAGYRDMLGVLNNVGYSVDWWSSSLEDGSKVCGRYMNSDNSNVYHNSYSQGNGCSVRCVRDLNSVSP